MAPDPVGQVRLRLAEPADVPAILAVYDTRVAWLAAQGRLAQWGDKPFSTSELWTERVRSHVDSRWLWLAVDGDPRPAAGTVLGTMAVTDGPPPYVAPVDEPEVYIKAFVTALEPAARGAAAALWRNAERLAVHAGASLLRLDCYAGGDGKLVRYYRSVGFQPVRQLTVEFPDSPEPYHGCLLARRLTAPA